MACLLVDGYVLTMDEARTTLPSGFVLIGDDGRIAKVGPMDDCPEAEGVERIDCAGRIVLPGLIDALHVHWTHLFPGMHLPGEVAGHIDDNGHVVAARLAACALASGGVTAALLEIPAPMTAMQVKAVLAEFALNGVSALAAVQPDLAAQIDGAAVVLTADVIALSQGRASEATLRATVAIARRLGRKILLRITPEGASAEELRTAQTRLGRTTVYHLMEMGLLDASCLLVCPEDLNDADRALIVESGCTVIGLPVADALRGAGSAAFSALARADAPCALGSEGPGTGWTCDMVEQMKAVVMIQNTLMLDPTSMSTERALEMATINTAHALGIADQAGSLEPGKRADIAVFDTRGPQIQVGAKPLSTFVACTRASEAEVVFAAGRRIDTEIAPPIEAAANARRAVLAALAVKGDVE